MNLQQIHLIKKFWEYECSDGCCSDDGYELFTFNKDKRKIFIGELFEYSLSTLLEDLLIINKEFDEGEIEFQQVILPKLNEEQINEFMSQFEPYDSVIRNDYPILRASLLSYRNLQITEYVSSDCTILVFNNEVAVKMKPDEYSSYRMVDKAQDILKYMGYELIISYE